MTDAALKEAVAALKLDETRPTDLIMAGKSRAAERLAKAASEAAGNLMMAEGYLVKGDVLKAHEWLVKARWRLAEELP